MWKLFFIIGALMEDQLQAVNITRFKDYDTFSMDSCISSCEKFSAFCSSGSGACCTCQCEYGQTYYKKCVASPGYKEGCSYHFLNSQYDGQSLHFIILSNTPSITQVGIIAKADGDGKLSKCELKADQCRFWNSEDWKDLFTNGRQSKDFYINQDSPNTQELMFINHKKDTSLYTGLLIKMEIQCKPLTLSCLMFKVGGSRTYEAETETSTKPTATWRFTNQSPKSSSKGSGDNIGLIIGMVILLILTCITVIVIVIWGKRKSDNDTANRFKRGKNQQSQKHLLKDAVYQAPENGSVNTNGPTETEFNNPTYFQLVDSGNAHSGTSDGIYLNPDVVFYDKSKKKDPNYDYPKIKELNLKKDIPEYASSTSASTPSKHIYADISMEAKPKPADHQYTDPDKMLDQYKRKQTTGYAALDTISIESKQDGHKPGTGYATLDTSSMEKAPQHGSKPDIGYTVIDPSCFDDTQGKQQLSPSAVSVKNNAELQQFKDTDPSPTAPNTPKYFELDCDTPNEADV